MQLFSGDAGLCQLQRPAWPGLNGLHIVQTHRALWSPSNETGRCSSRAYRRSLKHSFGALAGGETYPKESGLPRWIPTRAEAAVLRWTHLLIRLTGGGSLKSTSSLPEGKTGRHQEVLW